MLVLTRKTGQSIAIGGSITVTVNRVVGNRVTLAFDAPQRVRILRCELPVLDHESDDGSDWPTAERNNVPPQ